MKKEIGFVAIGQAGGNVGRLFEKMGYTVLYINTSEEDLKTLPDAAHKYHLEGGDGCNKDRAKAKKLLAQNIDRVMKEVSGNYICVSNVHTTVLSYEDSDYKKVQNNALLRLPDGAPLSSVARKKGFNEAKRVTGPDLMQKIFESSDSNGYRHYFYGSTEETLKKLRDKLQEKYPNINIVGMYSPPFRTLTEEEDNEIIKNINNTEADIVWVGLGAPKQEIWMNNHKNKIKGLMIGVGAGFDYHAGNIKRAPKRMKKCSLEWLYRLLQDPKRLFKRYFRTNTKFIKLVHKEFKNEKKS